MDRNITTRKTIGMTFSMQELETLDNYCIQRPYINLSRLKKHALFSFINAKKDITDETEVLI